MTMRPESWHACAWQQLQAGIALALCTTLLGCIGATPLHKHTRTPEGTEVKDIDLSFLHPGQTTRAEVREKLKLIDTGYQGDHFFLGRMDGLSGSPASQCRGKGMEERQPAGGI